MRMKRRERICQVLMDIPENVGQLPEIPDAEEHAIVIHQDGTTLVGNEWVIPRTYLEIDWKETMR